MEHSGMTACDLVEKLHYPYYWYQGHSPKATAAIKKAAEALLKQLEHWSDDRILIGQDIIDAIFHWMKCIGEMYDGPEPKQET